MLAKDLVVGLGEIGNPFLKLLAKGSPTVGYDVNKKLMDIKKYSKNLLESTICIHICIPYTKNFEKNVLAIAKKHHPQYLVIHSTIKPYTTERLQKKLRIPLVYSPTRGVHRRMIKDLKRYTKFYSVYKWVPRAKWASKIFSQRMKNSGISTKKMSSPVVLELAKIIVDTSYYGWLINYAQLSKMIATEHNVDYDEMWSFADEIQKLLGNRPKMFPGYIGGHCVIPNLDLLHNNTLKLIKNINSNYARKYKKRRTKSRLI